VRSTERSEARSKPDASREAGEATRPKKKKEKLPTFAACLGLANSPSQKNKNSDFVLCE
jgi:hypothetical protein